MSANHWTVGYLKSMRQVADPLADALVEETAALQGEPGLRRLNRFLQTWDAPLPADLTPAVRKFFVTPVVYPAWVDPELTEDAYEWFSDWGVQVSLILVSKSFPQFFGAEQAAKVFGAANVLDPGTIFRFVHEIVQLTLDVMTVGGLAVDPENGLGVVALQKLRLHHSLVRRWVMGGGAKPSGGGASAAAFDAREGVPISQLDLAGAIFGFALWNLEGLKQLEIPVTQRQAAASLQVWKMTGLLLGLDEGLQPDDFEQARLLLRRFELLQMRRSEAGISLMRELITLMRGMAPWPFKNVPVFWLRHLMDSRFVHMLDVPRLGFLSQLILSILAKILAESRLLRLLLRWLSRRLLRWMQAAHVSHGQRGELRLPQKHPPARQHFFRAVPDSRPPGQRPHHDRTVESSVRKALDAWRRERAPAGESLPFALDEPGDSGDVHLSPLPRPAKLAVATRKVGAEWEPREEYFKAPVIKTVLRLFLWIWIAFQFGLGILWDRIRRRSAVQGAAYRLPKILVRAGPTFVKLGQQMSLRVDVLPYAVCGALKRLLDDVDPLPFSVVQKVLRDSLEQPIGTVFSLIDPEPVGSASVACVYQALLTDGTRVAIKVRRPGIGKLFAMDLRALEWLLRFLELFLLPPGFTRNFIDELRRMLLEELDFLQEARFTELFGKELKDAKISYARTPKVFFEYCTRDVMVVEFVTGGFWVRDLLRAVEQEDERALGELRDRDIDPKVVARRYLKINRFGAFEGLFFHADLHPSNVLVLPGNKLILIDFGSCGSFTERELISWRRMMFAQGLKDVGAMVEAALGVLEPLPPIDIDEFTKRLEAVFFRDLYAIESKHSQWWERTSARIWRSFLAIAGEFKIPMNLNTLRMIRATMLADTVAIQLDNDLDPYAEFRKYEKKAGERSLRRLRKRIRRNILSPRFFIQLEQLYSFVNGAFYRFQRIVAAQPILNFSMLVGKASRALAIVLKTTFVLVVATCAIALVDFHYQWLVKGTPWRELDSFWSIWANQVSTNNYLILGGLLFVWVAARRMMHKLGERDL